MSIAIDNPDDDEPPQEFDPPEQAPLSPQETAEVKGMLTQQAPESKG